MSVLIFDKLILINIQYRIQLLYTFRIVRCVGGDRARCPLIKLNYNLRTVCGSFFFLVKIKYRSWSLTDFNQSECYRLAFPNLEYLLLTVTKAPMLSKSPHRLDINTCCPPPQDMFMWFTCFSPEPSPDYLVLNLRCAPLSCLFISGRFTNCCDTMFKQIIVLNSSANGGQTI